MILTINEIKTIIKEELRQFVEKQKQLCRDEYMECGNTVPCFEKFTQCEKDAAFQGVKKFKLDKSKKQRDQEKIAKGIYDLYKFIDENGGRINASEIPDELNQFLHVAEKQGNVLDTSDEFATYYSLYEPPVGYENKSQLVDLIRKQYKSDLIPAWAVEKEGEKYYWFDRDEPIEVPKDLIDFSS